MPLDLIGYLPTRKNHSECPKFFNLKNSPEVAEWLHMVSERYGCSVNKVIIAILKEAMTRDSETESQ